MASAYGKLSFIHCLCAGEDLNLQIIRQISIGFASLQIQGQQFFQYLFIGQMTLPTATNSDERVANNPNGGLRQGVYSL